MRKTILTILALIVMSAQCVAADWVWVHSTPNIGIFYDKDSITFEKKNDSVNRHRCSVWVKVVYDKAFVQKRYKANWAFSQERWHFDFDKNIMREGEKLYYDDDGQMVERNKGFAKWDNIAPDTFAELLCNRLKKYIDESEHRSQKNH